MMDFQDRSHLFQGLIDSGSRVCRAHDLIKGMQLIKFPNSTLGITRRYCPCYIAGDFGGTTFLPTRNKGVGKTNVIGLPRKNPWILRLNSLQVPIRQATDRKAMKTKLSTLDGKWAASNEQLREKEVFTDISKQMMATAGCRVGVEYNCQLALWVPFLKCRLVGFMFEWVLFECVELWRFWKNPFDCSWNMQKILPWKKAGMDGKGKVDQNQEIRISVRQGWKLPSYQLLRWCSAIVWVALRSSCDEVARDVEVKIGSTSSFWGPSVLISSIFCLGNVNVHAPKKSRALIWEAYFFPKMWSYGCVFLVYRDQEKVCPDW